MPLKLLTKEDLLLLLKADAKRMREGIKNNIPAVEMEIINNRIIEIAMELYSRMPADSKPIDLNE